MFRSWYAIGIGTGIGLVLVYSNSANAQQPESRHHLARTALPPHVANQRHAAIKKEREKEKEKEREKDKDSKALTSLKMEIRDLRKQVVAVESLRYELSELKG